MSQKGISMVVIVAVSGLISILLQEIVFRHGGYIPSYEALLNTLRMERPIIFVLSLAFPIILMIHFKNSVYYMVAGSAMIVLLYMETMVILMFSYQMQSFPMAFIMVLSILAYLILSLIFFFEKKFYVIGSMFLLMFIVILSQSLVLYRILGVIDYLISGNEFYRFYSYLVAYSSNLHYVIYILQVVIIYIIVKENESKEIKQVELIQGMVE